MKKKLFPMLQGPRSSHGVQRASSADLPLASSFARLSAIPESVCFGSHRPACGQFLFFFARLLLKRPSKELPGEFTSILAINPKSVRIFR